jgi:hypothetical protein
MRSWTVSRDRVVKMSPWSSMLFRPKLIIVEKDTAPFKGTVSRDRVVKMSPWSSMLLRPKLIIVEKDTPPFKGTVSRDRGQDKPMEQYVL